MVKKILLLGLVCIVFLAVTIPATQAFLNIKEPYDEQTKTITIKDWLGLSDYLTATLDYNTDSCLTDCRSDFTILLAHDLSSKKVIDNLRFMNLYGKERTNDVSYQLYVEQEIEYEIENNIWDTCYNEVRKTEANGSWIEKKPYTCVVETQKGTATKTELVEFDTFDFKKDIPYKVILMGNKPASVSIDWSFDLGGLDIKKEWAWWNATFTSKSIIQTFNATNHDIARNITIPINITSSTAIAGGWLDSAGIGSRFTNASENSQYKYEYDNITHTSSGINTLSTIVWLGLPNWDKDNNNTFYWYYDDSVNAETSNDIWAVDSNYNYTAVFQGELTDRTSNDITLTDGGTGVITTQGKFGYGYDSNSGGGDFASSVGLFGGNGSLTVSAWVFPTDDSALYGVWFEGDDGALGFGMRYGDDSGTTRFLWNYQDGACNVKADVPDLNQWYHVVATFDRITNCTLSIDGVLIASSSNQARSLPDTSPTYPFTIVADGIYYGAEGLSGVVDDVQVFARVLTTDEIALMYSAGAGMLNEYVGVREAGTTPIATTLFYPINQTTSSNSTLDFNCTSTATTAETLVNITTYIYFSNGTTYTNYTDLTGTTPSSFTQKTNGSSLSDGNHTWNCLAYDTSGASDWANENRTFMIDTTAPDLTIITPTNTSYSSEIIDMNYTATDTNLDKCWYSLDSAVTNTTISCTSNITGINSGQDSSTWIIWSNDTLNNVNSTDVTFLVDSYTPMIDWGIGTLANLSSKSQTYVYANVSVNETNQDTITFNIYSNISNVNSSAYTTAQRNITWFGLTDGIYEYNVTINDILSNENSTTTRTITLDTIAPSITLISNIADQSATSFPTNATANISSADTNLDECWYYTSDLSTNISYTCNSAFNASFSSAGSKTISYCANDTADNQACDTTPSFAIYSINYYIEENKDPIGEGDKSIITIYVNRTPSTDDWKINTTLYWNNTNYPAVSRTFTSSNTSISNVSFIVPNGTGNGTGRLISYYWEYNINGGTNITSSSNQTVYEIGIGNCVDYGFLILNYTMRDEAGRNRSSTANATIEIDADLRSHYDSSVLWNYHNTTYDNNAQVCMTTNISNYSTHRLDVTTKYTHEAHEVEYHYITNYNQSNGTHQEINLYDIATAQSTTYLIDFDDDDYLPVVDAIIDVWRYYVGDGEYVSVEHGKTNTDGQTILHLVSNDIRYKFYVWSNGELIYTSPEYIAMCQDTPCQINLKQSRGTNKTYSQIDNLVYSLTFDRDAKTVTLEYATSDGSSSLIEMNVTMFSNYLNDTVCLESESGSGGTLTCTIPAHYSNQTYVVDIYQDGEFVDNDFYVFAIHPSTTFGYTGIFLAVLLIITLGLMAIASLIGVVILTILGIVLASSLSIFSGGSLLGVGSAIMWVIVAGGIIIYKLNNRRTA